MNGAARARRMRGAHSYISYRKNHAALIFESTDYPIRENQHLAFTDYPIRENQRPAFYVLAKLYKIMKRKLEYLSIE